MDFPESDYFIWRMDENMRVIWGKYFFLDLILEANLYLEAFIYINIGYINFDWMPPMLCNSLYEMSGQFLLVGNLPMFGSSVGVLTCRVGGSLYDVIYRPSLVEQ